jgi:hypothetical protein
MFNWFRKLLGLHQWKYRNPYDRTCKVCDRHEVAFSYDWSGPFWWEVYSEGNPEAHKRSTK